jgi:hypothetical protein
MRALGQQLYAMGIRNTPLLESRSQLVRVLMLLYSLVGDAISMQYGGSEAHKNVKNSAGGKENVKHRELLTSIRRYYSNSFTDMAKQDAINIFLGHFVPKDGEPPLWELESDYYLHNFEVKNNATKLKIPPAPPSAPVPSLLDIATVNVNSAPTSSNSMVAVLTQSLPVPPSSTASTKAEKLVSKQKREDREAYLREFKRQLEEWWKEPLDAHNLPKYLYKENQSFGSNSERRRTSKAGDTSEVAGDGLTRSICSTMSDGFLQMYHPEELTSFDKALSYKFMSPMDLSNEVHDTASTSSSVTTTGRSNQTSRHTSTTSVRSTSSRKMEDFGDSQPTSRTVRSMSLPDISEEMERPVHRRTRETSSRDTKAEDFTTRGSIVQSPRNYKNVSAVAAEALKRHEEPLSIEDYASNRG